MGDLHVFFSKDLRICTRTRIFTRCTIVDLFPVRLRFGRPANVAACVGDMHGFLVERQLSSLTFWRESKRVNVMVIRLSVRALCTRPRRFSWQRFCSYAPR